MRSAVRRAARTVAAVVLFGPLTACGVVGGEHRGVAFIAPADGATVSSPVRIEMKAEGFTIEPIGPKHRNAGHFHVMVDVPCFDPGAFIEMHTVGFEHYGDGASSGELVLSPGRHTLCLQLGTASHVTLEPIDEIVITVV